MGYAEETVAAEQRDRTTFGSKCIAAVTGYHEVIKTVGTGRGRRAVGDGCWLQYCVSEKGSASQQGLFGKAESKPGKKAGSSSNGMR